MPPLRPRMETLIVNRRRHASSNAIASRAASLEESARANPVSRLAAIVEYSNDAIFSRTLDGTITTWNAAAERIFGYSADEIIDHSSRVLVPPRHRDEFRKFLSQIRRGSIIQSFETERVRKGGERIHVSLTLSPIRDAAGRLAGFSTTARDITDQRRVREALACRERDLADLFAEASIGLIWISPAGLILRANRAFCDMVECQPNQVIGRALKSFHPNGAVVDELLSRLDKRQTLRNVQTEFRTQKGRPRFVLVDANALWQHGQLVHSRWFVRDISRRKQLEGELLEISEREQRGFAQELHDGLGHSALAAHLYRIAQEALNNAIKHARPRSVTIRLRRDRKRITLTVADNGKGIVPLSPKREGFGPADHELPRQHQAQAQTQNRPGTDAPCRALGRSGEVTRRVVSPFNGLI